jgi:hypothetical protein
MKLVRRDARDGRIEQVRDDRDVGRRGVSDASRGDARERDACGRDTRSSIGTMGKIRPTFASTKRIGEAWSPQRKELVSGWY